MKLIYKVWIDSNGKAFGEGPYRLLKLVEKTGSLHKAAQEMGMSYRKAFDIIQRAESRLGMVFLVRKIGGESGGGSKLTDEGRAFMKVYEEFKRELAETMEKIYVKYFESPLKDKFESP
ncbi:MAG TPA: LysR family transcriptional regulator [Syntrophorhabdaceae bacterium]|nr:LysR family transcriptional regulator [Syntrophorhabdaceae bacterium]HPU29230.1 LysR family transcriptional regulator [Syntrophorhabdaceae bacterium]